jgi:Tfp pilus assembly major pilin PilA
VALKISRKKWVLLTLFIGIALVATLLYPTFFTDYSERALVATALIDQVDMKRQIEVELLQGKPTVTLSVVQRTPSYTRVVGSNGVIVLHLSAINTTVVLTPSVNGNEVRWSCSGDVMRNLVSTCRQPMAESILPLVKRAKGPDQPSR